jgi:hypothetical protein
MQRYQRAAKLVGDTLPPRELIVVTAFLRNLARLARRGGGLVDSQTYTQNGYIKYTADGRWERDYFTTKTIRGGKK